MKVLFLLLLSMPMLHAQQAEIPTENISKPMLQHSRIKVGTEIILDKKLPEGSGLIAFGGKLWTHNDSGDSTLYALDPISGKVIDEVQLPLPNDDWEEITHDSLYVYLGAIGNNQHLKDTLQIYRITKESLLAKAPVFDSIRFVWPPTSNKRKLEKVNFDCEAMVIYNDSIHLFTKEYQAGHRTRHFTIPAIPGMFTASYKSTLRTRVLVTGASLHQNPNRLVLSGYTMKLRPHLLVFSDFTGSDFLFAKLHKRKLSKRMAQVEGIATFDGNDYFVISEYFKLLFIETRQKLLKVTLE